METEAALTRRRAGPKIWQEWDRVESHLNWIELPDSETEAICRFNRNLGLRAADAAHLFVADRLSQTVDMMRLASFDKEMCAAAKELDIELAV